MFHLLNKFTNYGKHTNEKQNNKYSYKSNRKSLNNFLITREMFLDKKNHLILQIECFIKTIYNNICFKNQKFLIEIEALYKNVKDLDILRNSNFTVKRKLSEYINLLDLYKIEYYKTPGNSFNWDVIEENLYYNMKNL